MKQKQSKAVAGVEARAVRPTPFGAALVALMIAIPVGLVLQVVAVLLGPGG